MKEHNNLFTLCPLEQNLSDEQILELYHSGKLPYRVKTEDEDVSELMTKAISRTMRCKEYLSKGKTLNDVRAYYMQVFGGERREEAILQMKDKSLRARFISRNVGIMICKGILFAKTSELANALNFKSIKQESVERYIRQGKNGK